MASVGTLINRMRYWCAGANMGYSQSDRWNFNASAGNCDCSSLVIHSLRRHLHRQPVRQSDQAWLEASARERQSAAG